MKHIFTNHSWVTQLVTESIIKHENIALKDVIILNDSARKFNYVTDSALEPCLISFKRIGGPPKYKKISFREVLKYLKWYINLIRCKLILNKIIGENQFKLYVPQLHLYNYKLLSSHKNCVSFSFIEEGTLSYCTRDYINTRFPNVKHPDWIKMFLNFDSCFRKAILKQTMDDGYAGAYKIISFAFPDCKNVIDVSADFKKLITDTRDDGNIENLLILGNSLAEYKTLTLEKYLIGLEHAIAYIIANSSQPVYYKHHPSVKGTVRQELNKLVNKLSDRFKELDDNVCTEFLMAKYQPVTYLFNSTVAIYANEFNCKLVFLSKFIMKDTSIMHYGGIDFSPYYIEPNFQNSLD